MRIQSINQNTYVSLSRCESLVLYRTMYGNKAIEVQRRNDFVVGPDNTLFGGLSVCLGSWWNKLNN